MTNDAFRFLSVLAGCAAFLASTARAPTASACSPPAQGWNGSLASKTIPANGVLVITYGCYASCPEPGTLSVTVRDVAGGSAVPGTLSEVGSSGLRQLVYTWRPGAELDEGTYSVDLPLGNGRRHEIEIEVVAPIDGDPPDGPVKELAQIVETDEGERICCPTGPLDSCGSSPCYNTLTRRSVMIDVDLSDSASAAKLGQYQHRVFWEGSPLGALPPQEEDPIERPWQVGDFSRAYFQTSQDEYCYTLELKSLIDGAVTALPRVCVGHPSGGETGVFDRDPTQIRDSLGLCEAPPEDLTDAWCEAREERCAKYPTESCAALETLCAEKPVDPLPQGGAGGETTTPEPEVNGIRGGGCSVGGQASGHAAWLVAAFAFIALCRRRAPIAGRST